MSYTYARFTEELAAIKDAAASGDPARMAGAAAHARTVLSAGGTVGSITASRRGELQAAMAACLSGVVAAEGALRDARAAPPPEEVVAEPPEAPERARLDE